MLYFWTNMLTNKYTIFSKLGLTWENEWHFPIQNQNKILKYFREISKAEKKLQTQASVMKGAPASHKIKKALSYQTKPKSFCIKTYFKTAFYKNVRISYKNIIKYTKILPLLKSTKIVKKFLLNKCNFSFKFFGKCIFWAQRS